MLNKDKPYGEVFGGVLKYKYEQNNKYYNALGEEVDNTGRVIEKKDPMKNSK